MIGFDFHIYWKTNTRRGEGWDILGLWIMQQHAYGINNVVDIINMHSYLIFT